MDPDIAEHAKWQIQDYAKRNSVMVGNRGSQGILYLIGQTSSTTICSMFAYLRYQLSQSWDKEGFGSLYQALLMYEMVDPSTSSSAQVRVFGPSGIVDRPYYYVYISTINVHGCIGIHSHYIPFYSQE